MKYLLLYLTVVFLLLSPVHSQEAGKDSVKVKSKSEVLSKPKVLYGIASYYADKFNGRLTANGEIYDSKKMTAACNSLPLGTWIKVTNLNNNKSVIVKTNDRLHARMTRVVDMSRAAAEKLGFIKKGLTKVKVEVLEKK